MARKTRTQAKSQLSGVFQSLWNGSGLAQVAGEKAQSSFAHYLADNPEALGGFLQKEGRQKGALNATAFLVSSGVSLLPTMYSMYDSWKDVQQDYADLLEFAAPVLRKKFPGRGGANTLNLHAVHNEILEPMVSRIDARITNELIKNGLYAMGNFTQATTGKKGSNNLNQIANKAQRENRVEVDDNFLDMARKLGGIAIPQLVQVIDEDAKATSRDMRKLAGDEILRLVQVVGPDGNGAQVTDKQIIDIFNQNEHDHGRDRIGGRKAEFLQENARTIAELINNGASPDILVYLVGDPAARREMFEPHPNEQAVINIIQGVERGASTKVSGSARFFSEENYALIAASEYRDPLFTIFTPTELMQMGASEEEAKQFRGGVPDEVMHRFFDVAAALGHMDEDELRSRYKLTQKEAQAVIRLAEKIESAYEKDPEIAPRKVLEKKELSELQDTLKITKKYWIELAEGELEAPDLRRRYSPEPEVGDETPRHAQTGEEEYNVHQEAEAVAAAAWDASPEEQVEGEFVRRYAAERQGERRLDPENFKRDVLPPRETSNPENPAFWQQRVDRAPQSGEQVVLPR